MFQIFRIHGEGLSFSNVYPGEKGESIPDLIRVADREYPDNGDGWNRIITIRNAEEDEVAFRQSGTWKIVHTTE